MAEFFDISLWHEKEYYQTGGTRSKCIVEQPETEELYFFKTSLKKKDKDYKYEFWSEIIASEVGTALGLNMLKYEIAFRNGEIGCISKSMIDLNSEKLNEGISYLRGYDPSYDPETKDSHSQYSFAFIKKALEYYGMEKWIPDIIRTIIFDSLIGNGDRHQENWGFTYINLSDDIKQNYQIAESKWFRWLVKSYLFFTSPKVKKRVKEENGEKDLEEVFIERVKGTYSPIYDSGSCLGREIVDDNIDKLLRDSQMLNSYILRGKAEIRWDGPKINHFELIQKIKGEYYDIVTKEITKIVSLFDEQTIQKIVLEIDKNLPESLKQHKLPENRKELIIKMVTLRFQKLKELLK